MNFKKLKYNTFQAFYHEEGKQQDEDVSEDLQLFQYKNPFDFYRKWKDEKTYMPITQVGLRKAFTEDIIGIEYYLQMAASLRPLADEAQDIDEITRLFSQQKLSARPNAHSVKILRNMIKDINPEIALYAAEGLNSIEKRFITRIQKIKERIEENIGREYVNHYLIGKLYFDFASLQEGQELIQNFYLKEALFYLRKAYNKKSSLYQICLTYGEALLMAGESYMALEIFKNLVALHREDMVSTLKLAECYFSIKDYNNLKIILLSAATKSKWLDEFSKLIVYQWVL